MGKFFELINFDGYRMVDPFCGSGSFSFYAMRSGLTQSYLINDAFNPLTYQDARELALLTKV